VKKVFLILMICCACEVKGQSAEAQQLLLNIEKLTQFKKILQNMYDGYKFLNSGYTTIKDISEGNFSLHKNFLDALMDVSPAVKKYRRVADIINYQIRIVKEYKAAYNSFKQDKAFTIEEIEYLEKVYANLFDESLKSLNDLSLVITAGTLRMSDDERLSAIDRIYDAVVDQFSFLKDFNSSTTLLSLQRKTEQADMEMSQRLGKK
jgi:hypothetical protein